MTEMSLNWKESYIPGIADAWKGRIDSQRKERLHQLISPINLFNASAFPKGQKTVALLGFKSDEGILRNQGRIGASEGPDALRKALSDLPIHRTCPILVADAGNILCVNGNLEEAQKILSEAVFKLHALGATPFLLGGGHEIAWGHYQGIEKMIHNQSLAIINFDAHFDLRPSTVKGRSTSGTSFLQIAEDRKNKGLPFNYYCFGIQPLSNTESLFETAAALKVKTVTADAYFGDPSTPLKILEEAVQNNSHIYVSICMDVFSSSYAPGVSAPQPFGLSPWDLIPSLHLLARCGKLVGVDIAETSPPLDREGLTVKLGAALLAEMITNFIK